MSLDATLALHIDNIVLLLYRHRHADRIALARGRSFVIVFHGTRRTSDRLSRSPACRFLAKTGGEQASRGFEKSDGQSVVE
jgi:hypothetical protein